MVIGFNITGYISSFRIFYGSSVVCFPGRFSSFLLLYSNSNCSRKAYYYLDSLKGCSFLLMMQIYICGLMVTSLSQEVEMPARTKLAGFLQADSKCSGLPEKIDEKHYTNL